jgi:Uma2 family endonuclease
MPRLTIELPAHEDQTSFNLRRWEELLTDTQLGRDLARIEGRIETDRHGHIILYPPSDFAHGSFQSEIGHLLRTHLPEGRVATECPISTADGVRAADVAWISKDRLETMGATACLREAPEICVEVQSPSNTRREFAEKKALYFAAGAQEVWLCDLAGNLTFYCGEESTGETRSRLCPPFPQRLTF